MSLNCDQLHTRKAGREACLVLTLNPGAYTAVVSGANNSTGVGLVQTYIVW